MKYPYLALSSVISALLLQSSFPAHAAGLAISTQGAAGMGNAYAGAGASASDVATVWANPAGMLDLPAPTFGMVANIIATNVDFTDEGSTTAPVLGSNALSGDPDISTSATSFIPNLYYARSINSTWAVGFGISAPFGNSSDYPDDWIGRYNALETNVSAIDINPTIAYRISDKISIGGGVSLLVASAMMESAVDSGATCYGVFPAVNCLNAGLAPNTQEQDSYARIEGSGTAFTFNLSMLLKPSENTKIGMAFRKGSDLELSGNSTFTRNENFAGVLDAAGVPLLTTTGTDIEASLPSTLDVSISHQLDSKVELLGSLLWTQWSVFDQLVADFDNPVQPQSTVTFNYKDVYRASVGANYKLNDKITLRGGFAFDQEPVPSAIRRTARGPAGDRLWLSGGASYKISPRASVDAGFAHVRIDQSPIDNTGDAAGAPTLRGIYDLSANIASVQFNWHF